MGLVVGSAVRSVAHPDVEGTVTALNVDDGSIDVRLHDGQQLHRLAFRSWEPLDGVVNDALVEDAIRRIAEGGMHVEE